MKINDDYKTKATSLFQGGMPLSKVYYALQGKITYGDLWELKRELPDTGPVNPQNRKFLRGGGGGHGGGHGGGGGGGGGGGRH